MAAVDSTIIPDPAYLKGPTIADDEYTTARRALLEKEYALIDQIEEVAAQRRALPPGPIMKPYTFDEGPWDLNESSPTRETTLIDLVKPGQLGHKTLIVYHMMMGEEETAACSGCSLTVDGLDGIAKHVAQVCNLAIIAKAPLPALRSYAQKRGWNDVRLLSSFSSDFNKDMGVEDPRRLEMKQSPGFSVFRYEVGEDGEEKARFLYHSTVHFGKKDGKDVVRGNDLLTPLWNLLDLTPEGRGNFFPGLEYVEKWDGVKLRSE